MGQSFVEGNVGRYLGRMTAGQFAEGVFIAGITRADQDQLDVVVDEFIITSRGAGTSLELGLEIVRYLLGDEVVDEVARGVVLAR